MKRLLLFIVVASGVTDALSAATTERLALPASGDVTAGFRNVRFVDCKVVPSSGAVFYESLGKGSPGVTEKNTCLSGIAVESPDGGIVENIRFTNIDMTAGNVQTPVFLRLQRRNERPDGRKGAMRNIVIENVKAVNASFFPCAVVSA